MKQREQQRIKSNWIYKRQMEKEINVWYSEYEIRQFVDTATRSSIDVIYQNRTKQMPFGIFTNYVENARSNFELFSTELNEKLIKNENWKAIGIDLNSKFLIGINQYIKWHEENKSSLEKFNPYCPYTLMLNVIESTKAEILKYFPELDERNIIENPFNTPYNGMFTTSQIKTRFKLENGSIQERNIVNNTYDLRDTNIYDRESAELIEIDSQSSYNTSFLLKLGKMYIPNVKPYLTHQLKGSSKPTELIEYVRYCALNSEIIKSNGIKQAINDWLKEQGKESVPPQPIQTKTDVLKDNLQKGGFYNLKKVQSLSEIGQNNLIELLLQSMAYSIAMFDYLGFCEFLDKEKATKYKANHYLSKLFNDNAKDGTQARHYRNSLMSNKPRYTSYLHKEKVIKDYEQLK